MLNKEQLEKELTGVISWIQDYIKKAQVKGVVIGNSGGKDSATVIALATKALGSDKVISIAMPCFSSPKDLEDAKLVADTFGVKLLEVGLEKSVMKLEEAIEEKLPEKQISKEAKVNIKPRVRMVSLYAIAQSLGYLVMGTGNLCERMVGYTTKWGDNSSDLNPIGNFTVDEVLVIGKYLGVPDKILKKKPSDGLGILTDEEKMGITYKEIAEYIQTGTTNKEAISKIEQKYLASVHKRKLVPMYEVKRRNCLEEKMNRAT